jgi:hypothetical protein
MNISHTIIPIFAAFVSHTAFAEEKSNASEPTTALVSYYDALSKGNLDAAKELVAKFTSLPADVISEKTAKYSEGAKNGKIVITPVPGSAKVLGDYAVITFKDGDKENPDYDPAYLIRQEGKWKVFMKLTTWDYPYFNLTEEQKKEFRALEEWFDAEKKRLYGR